MLWATLIIRNKTFTIKRIGYPIDIAEMVEFLISNKAEWITGQDFIVDGGYTLG